MKIEIVSVMAAAVLGSKIVDAAVSNCKTRAVLFDKNNKFRILEKDDFKIIDNKESDES